MKSHHHRLTHYTPHIPLHIVLCNKQQGSRHKGKKRPPLWAQAVCLGEAFRLAPNGVADGDPGMALPAVPRPMAPSHDAYHLLQVFEAGAVSKLSDEVARGSASQRDAGAPRKARRGILESVPSVEMPRALGASMWRSVRSTLR